MNGRAISLLLLGAAAAYAGKSGKDAKREGAVFQTSDRCIACHVGLITPSGQDVSIGYDWRSSIMANSARDPYWQASIRREAIDHPESKRGIEDECSVCHMPMPRYESKLKGELGEVFSHFPLDSDDDKQAADGVSCSVCHQISKDKLGTRESFNGGFVLDAPAHDGTHREYGPFDIQKGQTRIMQSSTKGYQPNNDKHIQQSEVCATCHTLYTKAIGPGGKEVGVLPEQMPYPEWLHSDFKDKQSCQSCHMPVVNEPVRITRVLGIPRDGLARHIFVAANFFMQRMLDRYRDDLSVVAQPQELTAAADRTTAFLQAKTATIAVSAPEVRNGRVEADVTVVNLSGHKFPSAFPSRRAWLHVTVRDNGNRVVFESGALHPDGSIEGNDNDLDPKRFERHYSEIRSADQVQIYEDILQDENGHVTTGLLQAVTYAKDNRLLPRGFDKATADKDIAVHGEAAQDPAFTDAGHKVHYSVDAGKAQGPFHVEAELWYEPIGFRWANNLKPYDAAEPKRFTGYYDSMAKGAGVLVVRAEH
jgi:cytochrome c551/c552